jgi:hypothetical protein
MQFSDPHPMRVTPRSRPAWLCAGVAAGLLIGTLATVLWTRVDDVRDRAIVPAGASPTVIPLVAVSRDGTQQRLTLHTAAAETVVAHEEIDLAIVTGGARATVVRGTLAVGGCVYATADGTRVERGVLVRFVRTAPCDRGLNGSADASISVRLSAPEPLSVWVLAPSGPPPADALVVGPAGPGGDTPQWLIVGRYVTFRAASGMRRVDLLNYLWQLSPSTSATATVGPPYWIAGVLALAGALMCAGTFVSLRRHGPAVTGLGAGCLALAVGLLYAVLIPPFQAPDEPDHFLAFADLTGRPELAGQAAAWARLGHFQRIKAREEERFRPNDVGLPYAEAWDAEVFPIAIAGRSRTASALWTCVGGVTRGMRAPAVLLTLRLTNALVLAVAIAAGVTLVAAQAPGAAALCVAFAFLLVPTLPFFGTHVSDFAVLASTYVLFGCVVAALFLDGPHTHRLGLPIGLLATLTLAGGRSAGPMIVLVAATLAARATLGTRGTHDRREALRQAAVFWLGAACGLLLLALAASDEYRRSLFAGDASGVAPWFKAIAESVRTHAWWLAGVLPAGIAVELGARALRLRTRTWLRRPRAAAVRLAPAAIALAIVLVAAASLVIDLPATDFFDPSARPPLARYVGEALATLLTSVRLRHPDVLLSASFWGGFGWLDTILPEPLIVGLLAAAGCLALWLLAAIRRSGDERRAVCLAWLAAGWLAAFTVTAAASYFSNRSLHGRYLMGVYFACLPVVATAPALARPNTTNGPGRSSLPWAAAGVLPIACAALHAFVLSFILSRYF